MSSKKPAGRKKNQRREDRVQYKTMLEGFHLLQPGNGFPNQPFRGEIVDLSESGIGLSISTEKTLQGSGNIQPDFEEGTLVRLRIPITEGHVTMPVLGQIIWKKNSKQQKKIRAGIRFVI